MKATRESRPAVKNSVGGARPAGTVAGGARHRTRLVGWRRRHLNVRTVVAVIALSSLLAPGVAAIIDAAL